MVLPWILDYYFLLPRFLFLKLGLGVYFLAAFTLDSETFFTSIGSPFRYRSAVSLISWALALLFFAPETYFLGTPSFLSFGTLAYFLGIVFFFFFIQTSLSDLFYGSKTSNTNLVLIQFANSNARTACTIRLLHKPLKSKVIFFQQNQLCFFIRNIEEVLSLCNSSSFYLSNSIRCH